MAERHRPECRLSSFYAEQFGDPWLRAQNAGPIFPPGLTQPPMVLPFEPNRDWALPAARMAPGNMTARWPRSTSRPSTDKSGCTESEKWLVASTPGLVVRSEGGVVVLDLDGDGYEETGWNLIYLHVASKDRIKQGSLGRDR